jgi:hypothetical protein
MKGDRSFAMTLRGRIEDGKIVLEDHAPLPEGAQVEIYVIRPRPNGPLAMNPELSKYFGMADDMPPDSSQSIDLVLYGTPPE